MPSERMAELMKFVRFRFDDYGRLEWRNAEIYDVTEDNDYPHVPPYDLRDASPGEGGTEASENDFGLNYREEDGYLWFPLENLEREVHGHEVKDIRIINNVPVIFACRGPIWHGYMLPLINSLSSLRKPPGIYPVRDESIRLIIGHKIHVSSQPHLEDAIDSVESYLANL